VWANPIILRVPTPLSHAAVGYALGVWAQRGFPVKRVCIAAAACAALPDIDVLAAPLIAHRGITHSLLFAFTTAALATVLFFRGQGGWIFVVLSVALLSHSVLDAFSSYSVGLAFFAPFSDQRYRFVWTPLGHPADRLSYQLLQEVLVVLIPALLAIWLGFRIRRAT
jgi:inner membrane protein